MTMDVKTPTKAAFGKIYSIDSVEIGKPCNLPSIFTFEKENDEVEYWEDEATTSIVCDIESYDWINVIRTMNTYYIVVKNDIKKRYHYGLVYTDPTEGDIISVITQRGNCFLTKTVSKKVKVDRVWDNLKQFNVFVIESGKHVYMVYKDI